MTGERQILSMIDDLHRYDVRDSDAVLMLYIGAEPRSILELKPNGTFARHEDNLQKLGVSSDLVAAYVDAHAAADADAIIDVCRRIISAT